MFFLGIDGGGTKTEFLIIDEKGKTLGHANQPTCHYKQTSLQNFEKIITEGVNQVCEMANISLEQINYSLLGIPGYGEILDDVEKLESIIAGIFKSNSFKCVNDSVVAWAGSLACKPGINIVAGTGSIGLGMNENGDSVRAGGWGHFCGDEGSAYWLGKKVIEIFAKQADGRLEKTPLYDILKLNLGIEDDFDLIDVVLNEYEMKRGKIANMAKILHQAAKENDKFALDVFFEAAYELNLIIRAIIERLDFPTSEKISISYSGGVFNSGDFIIEPLKNHLKELNREIELITPILKPVSGAALYAQRLSNLDYNEEVIENLLLEEKLHCDQDGSN